jgi:HD domain
MAMSGKFEQQPAARNRTRSRRAFLVTLVGGVAWVIRGAALERAAKASTHVLPDTVAGIPIPGTAIARAAADLAADASPDFLFNHCVRTFLFGALMSQVHGVQYDAEVAFIASALHDLGLIERYSSKDEPFEIDGADAAKRFLGQRGFPGAKIAVIWDAIAMHTSALSDRKGPEVALVGNGAGVDVFGGGLRMLAPASVAAVVMRFPRLQFNSGFERLLLDYCQRKPLAQIGTWTDELCRSHVHGVAFPTIEQRLKASPFKE